MLEGAGAGMETTGAFFAICAHATPGFGRGAGTTFETTFGTSLETFWGRASSSSSESAFKTPYTFETGRVEVGEGGFGGVLLCDFALIFSSYFIAAQ
jgi:hypothetical protein